MGTTAADATLDARGKSITTFIAHEAHQHLDRLAIGETLEILTDALEPLPAEIGAWCTATGQRLVDSDTVGDGLRFLVQKQPRRVTTSKLAMVVSTDGLEELLSPLGFALAAALEGVEVHLYFQGPAVRVLTRRYRPKLRGLWRPFSRYAAASMNRMGHIPAQAKLEQLRDLGAHLYACAPSMEHFKVTKEDLLFDDLPLVEYLTFMRVMEQADIQLYA